MTVAGEILREGASIVEGVRNEQHGAKERSFDAIAALWTAYLAQRKRGAAAPVTGQDVASLMVLMKLVRAEHGTPLRDHFVDAAGYAAIAGELALPPPSLPASESALRRPLGSLGSPATKSGPPWTSNIQGGVPEG